MRYGFFLCGFVQVRCLMFGFVFWVLTLGLSVVEVFVSLFCVWAFVFGDLGFWMELFTDCELCVCVCVCVFFSLCFYFSSQESPFGFSMNNKELLMRLSQNWQPLAFVNPAAYGTIASGLICILTPLEQPNGSMQIHTAHRVHTSPFSNPFLLTNCIKFDNCSGVSYLYIRIK